MKTQPRFIKKISFNEAKRFISNRRFSFSKTTSFKLTRISSNGRVKLPRRPKINFYQSAAVARHNNPWKQLWTWVIRSPSPPPPAYIKTITNPSIQRPLNFDDISLTCFARVITITCKNSSKWLIIKVRAYTFVAIVYGAWENSSFFTSPIICNRCHAPSDTTISQCTTKKSVFCANYWTHNGELSCIMSRVNRLLDN